jgi:N6-adenosine-specific RNA methylase IME4
MNLSLFQEAPAPAPRAGGPFARAVVDFPWEEYGGGGRGAQEKYPLVPVKEGPRLIIGSGLWRFQENAHLWLWVTSSFDKEGHWLMEQLGFRYVTDYIWRKPHIGVGQYRRSNHERILFGTRGSGMHPSVHTGKQAPRSVFDWDCPRGADGKRIHSRKPAEAFTEVFNLLGHGPGLEMFGRGKAHSAAWTIWGNQAHQEGPWSTEGGSHAVE